VTRPLSFLSFERADQAVLTGLVRQRQDQRMAEG
jgi:hypothetical protein